MQQSFSEARSSWRLGWLRTLTLWLSRPRHQHAQTGKRLRTAMFVSADRLLIRGFRWLTVNEHEVIYVVLTDNSGVQNALSSLLSAVSDFAKFVEDARDVSGVRLSRVELADHWVLRSRLVMGSLMAYGTTKGCQLVCHPP